MLDGKTLTSTDADGRDTSTLKPGAWLAAMANVHIDKVIVVGAPASWATKKDVAVTADGRTTTAAVEFTPARSGRAAFAVVPGRRRPHRRRHEAVVCVAPVCLYC